MMTQDVGDLNKHYHSIKVELELWSVDLGDRQRARRSGNVKAQCSW
jgi:hypothetical protein